MKVDKQVVLRPYRKFNKSKPPKDGKYLVILNNNPNLMMVSEWKNHNIGGKVCSFKSWTLGTERWDNEVTHYMPIPKFFATSKRTVYS